MNVSKITMKIDDYKGYSEYIGNGLCIRFNHLSRALTIRIESKEYQIGTIPFPPGHAEFLNKFIHNFTVELEELFEIDSGIYTDFTTAKYTKEVIKCATENFEALIANNVIVNVSKKEDVVSIFLDNHATVMVSPNKHYNTANTITLSFEGKHHTTLEPIPIDIGVTHAMSKIELAHFILLLKNGYRDALEQCALNNGTLYPEKGKVITSIHDIESSHALFFMCSKEFTYRCMKIVKNFKKD